MTRTSSSTLVNLTHQQMLPSQPQYTGKRKPEDINPLLNAAAAKRARKDAKSGASNKRKLNIDEGPSNLLIVRAPESQLSLSQPLHSTHADPPRFASQPSTAGPSKPPTKKFRADSQPPGRPRGDSQTKGATRDRVAYSNNYDDSEVEKDVRAMEDEADHLRRNSRAHTTVDSSLLASDPNVHFATRAEPPGTSRGKGKTRIVDISTPMPENDTPKIERNKQLRSGAMAAIVNGREPNSTTPSKGHRRKSSVSGRGKRISTSFEATGVITQPHNSVSETSFYKHIDCDLPESERIRQLLIWCSLRAGATSTLSTSKSSAPPLPPLSAEGIQTLKSAQEGLVRMLAEKRIDLSLYSSESSGIRPPQEDLQENEQNVRNRKWEVTYTEHIQRAENEEEAWKKVSYGYDAYTKKLQASLEKRSAALQGDTQPSAKAKGKRRATGDVQDLESNFIPHEHELSPEFLPALALAKSVLGYHSTGDDRIAGGGRLGVTRTGLSREEAEAEIKRRLPSLEFKVDQIFNYASAAQTTTNIAEKMLNERFDILNANLTSRVNPFPTTAGAESSSGSTTQILSTYVVPRAKSAGADPLDLMRALSRVDRERPPAQVGDAARRAAREVQRAEESGFAGAVGGDKRLTGLPATPRKAPGTPRRGNTPARDR